MRLLVTGSKGQLVTALLERGAAAGVEIIPVGRPQLDLADPTTIAPAIAAAKPDAIISAAAYTAVDKAQSERELAFAVNAIGPGAVAGAAAQLNLPVIHISTDYVFNGAAPRPCRETDLTAPLGIYGASKLAGEHAVAAATPNHAILRTAWVYSPFGANFLKTMLRLAAERPEINVVADQLGNPTAALDLADAILRVAGNLVASPDEALRGIFHCAGTGDASWADFATEIMAISEGLGGPAATIHPIPTSAYPTPAPRPANSRLDCSKLRATHGVVMPPWQQSTQHTVERLLHA
ncbi:dTDP-4-dehydrorhamnose reductase [Devosia sp. 1566]|uniref:dTDP-4-dehydrorhamnose reductase n=1 Tax=Devosia sp. 1566 TaxID=2499144 RepID=UPI000FD72578|nr:dTDP-4-dehydrorhamnose reductase [Devosia sp. 1566]